MMLGEETRSQRETDRHDLYFVKNPSSVTNNFSVHICIHVSATLYTRDFYEIYYQEMTLKVHSEMVLFNNILAGTDIRWPK
jgi:hypothetical protein